MKKILAKIVKHINALGEDKKDHNLLGQFTGFPMVFIGLILDLIFIVLNTSNVFNYFIFSNSLGLLMIILYWLKEYVHDGKQGKGTKEFLDWWYNSLSVFQYLIIINLISIFLIK